ncbi:MAG: lambda-exonuclease family protein [Thomasclavelia spiroformis]
MLNLENFFSNCNVDYVKDVDQWHELRGKGIGGSDAGIVMNVSSYKTPYELWKEKTGKVDRPFITNEAIEKGNLLEPLMFEMFKTFYSKEYEVIDTKNISLSSKQFPFLRANLDGALIERDTNKKGILEIKSTTIQNAAMFRYWNDDVPILYFFQCLHYLNITGFDFVVVYAILDIPWANRQETRVIKMYREDLEADIELLVKTELWFWDKVKTNTPPPFLEKRNKNLIN